MLLSHHVCNVAQQRFDVDKVQRSQIKRHRPCIVWFTGLSGAGKSTIMNLVEVSLSGLGMHTYSLDGDNLRDGLNCDLGFTKMDRIENIRRAGEVARFDGGCRLDRAVRVHIAISTRAAQSEKLSQAGGIY